MKRTVARGTMLVAPAARILAAVGSVPKAAGSRGGVALKARARIGALVVTTLALGLFAPTAAAAQENGKSAPLTARDRAEIQQLVADYARTLGSCLAEEYAALFESPEGFFESVSRGRVLGRQRLIPFVKSERCGGTQGPRAVPTTVIEESRLGVLGKADLGAIGHYEDVYVKTAAGWRFRSRNYIPTKAENAKFTFRDFAEIRQLAGDHGQFRDVYIKTPEGLLFRSSGMTIDPISPGEATGRVHLQGDEGRYDDVYVKTSAGWRFKSRTYVAVDDVAPFNRDSRPQR